MINMSSSSQAKENQKRAFKVISGINNFNINQVCCLAKAAEIAGATYIDVAANPYLVRQVKEITNLEICISSIDPSLIYQCITNGATIIEIGNYDIFYNDKYKFSTNRIITLTEEIKALFPNIKLCVTIPHHLTIKEQINLTYKLTDLNVDLLQTEGITSYQELPQHQFILSSMLNKVSATLSTTYVLSQLGSPPIITASGITHTSASLAVQYGAAGIGVSSALIRLDSINNIIRMIQIIQKLLSDYPKQSVFSYSLGNVSLAPYLKSKQIAYH